MSAPTPEVLAALKDAAREMELAASRFREFENNQLVGGKSASELAERLERGALTARALVAEHEVGASADEEEPEGREEER